MDAQLARSMEKMLEEAELCGSLSLAGRKMKEFPSDLSNKYDLSDLISLDLSGNRLTDVPTCVCESRSLESLRLRDNVLRSVPLNIIFLRSLTVLDLSNNKIVQLPLSLFELPLEIVLLTGNRLESIPREIRQLSSTLAELDVSWNFLRTIPADIALLKMLRVLNLRHNFLEHFPSELCRLSLHTLDLSSNRLRQLPFNIGKMESLVELYTGNNPLLFPPASLIVKGREHIIKWMDLETSVGSRQFHPDEHNASRCSSMYDSVNPYTGSYSDVISSSHVQLRKPKAFSRSGGNDSGYASTVDDHKLFQEKHQRAASFAEEGILSDKKPHIGYLLDKADDADTTLVAVQNGNVDESCQTVFEDMHPGVVRLNSVDLSNNNSSVINNTCCATENASSSLITSSISSSKRRKCLQHLDELSSAMDKSSPVVGRLVSQNAHSNSLNPDIQMSKVTKTKLLTALVAGSIEKKTRSASRILNPMASKTASATRVSNSPPSCSSQRSRLPSHISQSSHAINSAQKSSTVGQPRQTSAAKPALGKPARVTVAHFNRGGIAPKPRDNQAPPADLIKKVFSERLHVELPDNLETIAKELADGAHLCSLVNALRAQTIPSFFTSSTVTLTPPKAKRNIDKFISSCRKLGVPEKFICSPNDILNKKNTPSLVKTVVALNKLFPPQDNNTSNVACPIVVDKRKVSRL